MTGSEDLAGGVQVEGNNQHWAELRMHRTSSQTLPLTWPRPAN